MSDRKPPPRLPLVDAPGDPLVGALFERLAAGHGVLNLHRMMAHAPPLLQASGDMARALRDDTVIERALAEIVILRTAQVAACDYVWQRHLPLARAAGVNERQIGDVAQWRDSAAFTPAQKAALGFAEQLARGGTADDGAFAALQQNFPPRAIVALTMLVGYYLSTVIFIKALAVPDERRRP